MSGIETVMSEVLEGATGKNETGVRLDHVVAALKEAGSVSEDDARRLLVYPYGALTTAVANLRGYPKLGRRRSRLVNVLEESIGTLAPFMSLPPPLPRKAGKDQRRAVRARVRIPVLYYGQDRSCTGYTADISSGGMFIESDQLFPVGTEVNVFLVLPPCDEIRANVGVRWVRDKLDSWTADRRPNFGMGVSFTQLSPEAEETLLDFLRRSAPPPVPGNSTKK